MTLGQSILRMTGILALASAALAAAGSSHGRSAKSTATPSAGADYSILVQRNIFDRNRRAPVVRKPQPPRPKPAYTPPKPVDTDQYFVLRGIALEGSQFTAFFEDTRAGKILQVRPGDVVGKGRIPAINIDSAQYQRGEKLNVVLVGHTLAGSRAPSAGFETPAPSPSAKTASTAIPAAPSPKTSTTTQPTAAPAGTPTSAPASGGLQDILERMRRRREQELGR